MHHHVTQRDRWCTVGMARVQVEILKGMDRMVRIEMTLKVTSSR
jgi:hypothetical protein